MSTNRSPLAARALGLPSIGTLVLGLLLTSGSPLAAQDYVLSVPSATIDPLDSAVVPLSLDNSTGGTVTGISAALCFDPDVVTAIGTLQGSATTALDGGAGPDFFQTQIQTDVVTLGVLTSLLGGAGYLPAADHEILLVTFTATGAPLASTPLAFCVAGDPPINNVVIHDPNQTASTPTLVDGNLSIGPFQGARLAWRAETAAPLGGVARASILLDASEPVQAFSGGATFDPTALTFLSADPTGDLAALGGGAGPETFIVTLLPGGSGFTFEVVTDATAPFETIPAGFDQPVIEVVLEVPPTATLCAATPLALVDGLGTPAVPVAVSTSTGALATTTVDTTLRIVAPPGTAPSGGSTLAVDSIEVSPGASAPIAVRLDCDLTATSLSFGLAYDASDVAILSIAPGSTLAATRCGAGPELFDVDVFGGTAAGLTVRAIIEGTPPFEHAVLLPDGDAEVVSLTFTTSVAPQVGGTLLTLTDMLGTPPVPLLLETDAGPIVPATTDGVISLGVRFRRGDCNDDSMRDIADAIAILGTLFPPSPAPPPPNCFDACDANDDGVLDIADAIFHLAFLFTQGDPPPAPGGTCGVDGAPEDGLPCAGSTVCP